MIQARRCWIFPGVLHSQHSVFKEMNRFGSDSRVLSSGSSLLHAINDLDYVMLRLHVFVYLTPTFESAVCSGLSCELHLLVHYCVSYTNFSYKK